MTDAFNLPSVWVADFTRSSVIAQFEIMVVHDVLSNSSVKLIAYGISAMPQNTYFSLFI